MDTLKKGLCFKQIILPIFLPTYKQMAPLVQSG